MNKGPYWIPTESPGRLAIVHRPRGGDWLKDDTKTWSEAGLTTVVSLLEPQEADSLGLKDEARFCQEIGLDYLSFPIPDRETPVSQKSTMELVQKLDKKLETGETIGVHCRQGIGRAPLIAACLLIETGVDVKKALQRIRVARRFEVPETLEQLEWIEKFARLVDNPLFA